MRRPFGVTLVAILVLLAAVLNIILGIWLMLAPIGNNPSITDLTGNTQSVSGFYLFINGLLSFILGLMYFWLAKMTMMGSATAYALINFLAILNIFFGLFRLPYGWGEIILNVLVIIIVNTRTAKTWFTRAA